MWSHCKNILCLFTFLVYMPVLGQVSPNYFGPNAFPVPEMLSGKIDDTAYWLEYSCIQGKYNDRTVGLTSGVSYKVSNVTFNVWWDIVEFSCVSSAWLNHTNSETFKNNVECGDVYVSTDFQVLNETDHKVNLTVRSVLKTASGGDFRYRRFYDSAGYYFDSSIGKSLFGVDFAGNVGFVCWQTDMFKQNDAFLYGLMVKRTTDKYEIKCSWEGYTGWQNNGDSPSVLRFYLETKNKIVNVYERAEFGLNDWPYTQITIGVKFNLLWK